MMMDGRREWGLKHWMKETTFLLAWEGDRMERDSKRAPKSQEALIDDFHVFPEVRV